MNLWLKRDDGDSYATFGVLHGLADPLQTMEAPAVFREPGASYPYGKPFYGCVPEGEYSLQLAQSPRWGLRWHLVGLGVRLRREQRLSELERFACLFHPANWPDQIEGCVALGLSRGQIFRHRTKRNEFGVSSSGPALDLFQQALQGAQDVKLTITR